MTESDEKWLVNAPQPVIPFNGNTSYFVNGAGQLSVPGGGGTITLGNGTFLIGNATNVAVAHALSGDVTSDNTGNVTIGNSTITTAKIASAAVTYAKIQNITSGKLLGSTSASAAAPGEVTVSTGLALSTSGVLTATGGGTGGVGALYPSFTAPVDANYAWVNQGGASVTVNANGGIFLRGPKGTGANLRVRKLATPNTTGWTLTAALMPSLVAKDFQNAGILCRESSSGKMISIQTGGSTTVTAGSIILVSRWNSATSFNTNSLSQLAYTNTSLIWYRIQDDGTNLLFSYSLDGYNFIQVNSQARGAFFTGTGKPDEIGFFVDEETNTYDVGNTLLSWSAV